MKLFPAKPKKPAQILQASVVRRSARTASIEQEEEPTTSFTTALVVVVMLHVVFAGGIYMFESINTHHPEATEGRRPAVAKTAMAATSAPAAAAPITPATHPKAAEVAAPAAAEPVKKSPVAATATAPAAVTVKDSGTTYTVVKGDNPVNISKRLRVSQEDLLKLNRIDDPKKLRIGQKLRVPVKLHASSN
jgi:LysM repeat protein